jgi:hypothetical protein
LVERDDLALSLTMCLSGFTHFVIACLYLITASYSRSTTWCTLISPEMCVIPGHTRRQRPKKLPCNHSFHLGCLRSWLERQQACPTCRSTVMPQDANAAADRPADQAEAAIQVGR